MKQTAKHLVFLLLAGATALSAWGCGVGTTAEDNSRTLRRVADYDARMLTDDLGTFTNSRRPWRGSRYPIK